MDKPKSIQTGDVVLVVIQGLTSIFTHIRNITLDVKTGWWNVTFLLIGPSVEWNCILDSQQLAGEEFTVNNVPHKLIIYSSVNAISATEKVKEVYGNEKAINRLVAEFDEDNSLI